MRPALVTALGDDGIVTSERDSNLRVSPHAYNTEDDIDAVLAGLAKHGLLATSGVGMSPTEPLYGAWTPVRSLREPAPPEIGYRLAPDRSDIL